MSRVGGQRVTEIAASGTQLYAHFPRYQNHELIGFILVNQAIIQLH
jgi:hypothetical protein